MNKRPMTYNLRPKTFYIILALILAWLILPQTAQAAEYWLDAVNGDDSNLGIAEAPWKTIAKALNSASSGDTVIMASGTYDAFIDTIPSRSDWLTFQAASGAQPELPYIKIGSTNWNNNAYLRFIGIRVISNEAKTGGNRILYVKDAPYVELKDCYLYGYKRYLSIGVLVQSNNFTLDHCEVFYDLDPSENFPTVLRAEYLPGKTRGVELYGSNIKLINNYIHDFASSGIEISAPSTNMLIENNNLANQRAVWPGPNPNDITNSVHGSGIALMSGDVTIRRNIIHAVGRTKPINVYSLGWSGKADNLVIENNLFFDNSQSVTVGTSSEGRFGSGCKFNHNTVICMYDKFPPASENSGRYRWAFYPSWDENYSGDFEFYNNLIVGRVGNPVSGPNWQAGVSYSVNNRVSNDATTYDCAQTHTSSADNQPGIGKDWKTCWVLAPGRIWNAGGNIVFAYRYPYYHDIKDNHWNTLENSIILCSGDAGHGWHWKGAGWDPEADFFVADTPEEMLLPLPPEGYYYQTADFRLKANSPAINYGDVTKAIAVGKSIGTLGPDGFIRDDGPARDADHHSAGCYEYGASTFLYGDVSGDGEISAYDAALTAQAAVDLITLTAEQTKAADVNGDAEVSAYDAALIAQKAVGLIEKFPVE